MKKTIVLIGLAGALFAATVAYADDSTNTPPPAVPAESDDQPLPPPPDDTVAAPDQATPPALVVPAPAPITPPPTPAAVAPSVSAPVVDTNVIAPIPPGVRGLRLNFRNAPLEAVLNYLSAAAGFIIHPKTDLTGKVTVWSEQPLTSDEAVALLKRILNDNGYTLLPEGKTLTIIRTSEAPRNNVPVHTGTDPSQIPQTADIVTQIMPLHGLNAVQVVKDLDPLKPADTTLSANDSANSLVMTGTQANIHRFAEILNALDSVNSSAATIRVYPLKFADAKSIATLITSLFPSQDNTGGRGGGSFGFGRFRGGGGGGFNPFGGGGGGGDTPDNNGHTPTAKVTAVSDDHSNSLVVSAPDALITTIDDLIQRVDTPVDDTTEMQVFHLVNADPGETADLITQLFPDDSGSTDASRQGPQRFGFFGGFGGFGQGRGAGGGGAEAQSDRMKRMAHVVAVPDRRTSSLVVTAGTNIMGQIAEIVMNLDARTDRKMSVHVIPLMNADPVDVQNILQDIYPATTTGGSSGRSSLASSASSNPLLQRQQTLLQQQNQSGGTSSFGSGSSSGSTTGRGF